MEAKYKFNYYKILCEGKLKLRSHNRCCLIEVVTKAGNHIGGGVMVSVFASNVVNRGFEPRSCQIKDYKIGICCFSDKHTA